MIVKCDKCQTRFKIPDEKVTERGVKVRCTRCQHTFRVTRGDDVGASPRAAAPVPPVAPAVPPLGGLTDPFARFGGLEEPKARAGAYEQGIAASRNPDAGRPAVFGDHEDVSSEFFEQPTRVSIVPPDLLAAPPEESGVTPGFDADSLFGELLPPSAGDSTGTGAAVGPPAARPVVTARAPQPRPESDFEATVAATAFFPPPELPPSRAPAKPSAAAAQNLQRLPPPPPSAPAALAEESLPPDDFFGHSEDAALGSAAEMSGGLLGDLPPADDLFGRPNTTLTSHPIPTSEVAAPSAHTDAGPDRGFFDMPAAPPPASSVTSSEVAAKPAPVAEPARSPAERSPAAAPVPVGKPTRRPRDLGIRETRIPGAVRRTVGLVVNLAIASLLVVAFASVGTIYLNEGRVDLSALSAEPLKAMFQPPGTLLPFDVTNGLYETREGKALFYVRGEVENRGTKPSRVQVKVEILDGPVALTSAEVLAGRAANPEELHSVHTAEALATLVSKLDADATEVKPGERRPFLVPFYEYPPELGDYRLKVTLTEAPVGKAASR